MQTKIAPSSVKAASNTQHSQSTNQNPRQKGAVARFKERENLTPHSKKIDDLFKATKSDPNLRIDCSEALPTLNNFHQNDSVVTPSQTKLQFSKLSNLHSSILDANEFADGARSDVDKK